MLESITVHGYRGFKRPGVLEFALPNGKIGSGITAIVGPNNGGKTSIVEALSFLQRPEVPQLNDAHRNGANGGQFNIVYNWRGGKLSRLASPQRGGQILWREHSIEFREGGLLVIPSRRNLDQTFGQGDTSRKVHATGLSQIFQRSNYRPSLSSRLFAIEENRTEFDRILLHVLGKAPDWYIEKNSQGNHFIRFSTGSATHSGEGLGDGFTTAFFVADALHDSRKGDVIVLDEPELSLHPAQQRRLAHILAEYAKDRQIIYATHSPYFAEWQNISNGGRVARVWPSADGSRISALGQSAVDGVRDLIGGRANPHILGVEAREVFFLEDRVVLVEGQEDVVLYPSIAQQCGALINGDFYGWGVGGAGNMARVAAVLVDLGFEKVVGLLDQGQEDHIAELSARFRTYLFLCIPARDIRTKSPEPARPAVMGLLDSSGKVRRDLFKAMSVVLRRANDYLSDSATHPTDVQSRTYEVEVQSHEALGEPLEMSRPPVKPVAKQKR